MEASEMTYTDPPPLPHRPGIKSRIDTAPVWYALQSVPMKEFAAFTALRRHGMTGFLPVEYRWRRHNRWTRRRMRVAYPMFVGYLFVQCDGELPWMTLLEIDAVRGVVAFDGKPAPIADSAMRGLMRVSGVSVPHRASVNTHRSLRPGDLAMIAAGPFRDRTVTIEQIDKGKARIFLDLFGVVRPIDVPLEHLEAA